MDEVDCDAKYSDSRRESHVIAPLLRRFATPKLDILGARYEFMNQSELPERLFDWQDMEIHRHKMTETAD